MSEIESAEKTVRDLEDKRRDLIQKATELADERQRVSFAAHTGDAKARARLDQINLETATQASELASIEAAIVEGNSRLEVARRDAAAAADREAALQLKAKLDKFIEVGAQIDDALWDLAESTNEAVKLLDEMHALGQAFPTSEQFRVNSTLCIKSAIQSLPDRWIGDFEFQRLSPGQKKKFKDVMAGWAALIEANIAARLGENKTSEAA